MNNSSTFSLARFTPAIISGLTLVVMAIFVVVGWQILKGLPSYQLARFPQFVQNWVIPEPESATLPTVGEVDTAALFDEEDEEVRQVVTNTIVAPLPTAESTAIPAPPESTDTPVPTETNTPTPTMTPSPTPTPLPEQTRFDSVVHHTQDWNNCGPATAAMALSVLDEQWVQWDTAQYLKPNVEDRNVTPDEIADFVNEQTDVRGIARVNGDLETLKQLLANGFPVIIEVGLEPQGEVAWLEWYGHYLLAAGYDDASQELWVYDSLVWDSINPLLANGPNGRPYSYDELAQFWPQFNSAFVVMYDEAREDEVADILADDWDTELMWERTLSQTKRALLGNQDSAFTWFNLGTAYAETGDYSAAATAFDKAREIGLPWRMLWYQFAPYEAYFEVGRYDDVVMLADITLDGRPFFEESFYWRGRAQLALGNEASGRADLVAANQFNLWFEPAATMLTDLNDLEN